ncbi:MAG TPA: hypothetical protein VGG85_06035 [Terracidiphilus sp.]
MPERRYNCVVIQIQSFEVVKQVRVKKAKKQTVVSDDTVSWIGVALALAAAILFDRYGMPQKWHAAIMWTVVAFGPPTVTRRKRWGSPSFWGLWTLFLALHLLIMGVVFYYLLAKVRVLGTLYVVPFATVEAFVLLVLFSRKQARRSVQSTR